MLTIISYICIGILSGISMGVIGIGAGLITIPLLIYSGLTIQQAVSIGLIIQIIPQTLPATIIYYRNGVINKFILWITFFIIIGNIIGTSLGAYLVTYNYLSKKIIYRFLIMIVFISNIYLYVKYWNIKDLKA